MDICEVGDLSRNEDILFKNFTTQCLGSALSSRLSSQPGTGGLWPAACSVSEALLKHSCAALLFTYVCGDFKLQWDSCVPNRPYAHKVRSVDCLALYSTVCWLRREPA